MFKRVKRGFDSFIFKKVVEDRSREMLMEVIKIFGRVLVIIWIPGRRISDFNMKALYTF